MNLDALIEVHNTKRQTLNSGIAALVVHINQVYKDHSKAQGYTHNSDTKFVAQVLSDKWVRINQQELRDGEHRTTSVYCFVALTDYETKGLGQVKAGDIHKPASFKAPAKHARGSALDETTWTCIGPYGVAYLR